MKIPDYNLGGAATPETHRTQDAQSTGHASGARSAGSSIDSDRVEFSGGMGSLSRAVSSFQSGRAGRVQALATQYQSGSYRPDSAAISRGMIQEALGAGPS
jgi:anti-sigma28 factor (negative regulator of flagellin synthesis)